MNLPSVQINKILYATDLSETAVHAFAYAASMAAMYGASISILHVLADFPGEDFITNMINTETWKEIKQRHYSDARDQLIGKRKDHRALKEVLKAFSAEAVANSENGAIVTDEIMIKTGAPSDVIIEAATGMHADLIVMGTHGHGAITDMLIGSTAKRVVRQSTIPVLVVRLS